MSERDDDIVEAEAAAARVERLVQPSLDAMGYDIVRVSITGRAQPTLQIMAERRADGGMNVDDCAAVSRAVSEILDTEDPISGAYTLEVSSPGIDRPLTRPKDFVRYAGHEAKLETRSLVEGRKRFKGRVLGIEGEIVRFEDESGPVGLPFAEIRKARLVLTDALLAEAQKN